MSTVQIILIAGLLLIIAYVYLRLRSAMVDAIVFILLGLVGTVFVIFPELTTRVANAIGIGRGADMIFYFSILFFGFVCLKLYARVRKLEQQLTKIIRDIAIFQAEDSRSNS